MGGEYQTKVPLSEIFDGDRGLLLPRGAYVEAPPEFFKRYGDLMENPARPYNPKTDFKMRLDEWLGMPTPKVKEVVKEPEPEPETVAEPEPEPEVEAASPEAPSEEAPKKKKKLAMTTEDAPRPRKKGRTMTIRRG